MRYVSRLKPIAWTLVVVLATAVTSPLAAAEPPAPQGAATTAPAAQPLAAAAAAKVSSLPAEALAPLATTQEPAATSGDKPFFKTRKGAIAGVLLAAALGYMAYSMSDDRVKSPAK
jgi:hypothetical protein